MSNAEEYERFLQYMRELAEEIMEKFFYIFADVEEVAKSFPNQLLYHGYPTIEEEIKHFEYDPFWEIKTKKGD